MLENIKANYGIHAVDSGFRRWCWRQKVYKYIVLYSYFSIFGFKFPKEILYRDIGVRGLNGNSPMILFCIFNPPTNTEGWGEIMPTKLFTLQVFERCGIFLIILISIPIYKFRLDCTLYMIKKYYEITINSKGITEIGDWLPLLVEGRHYILKILKNVCIMVWVHP